ncbi:MAG: CvpA family protein [Ignavibacteriales bacterium]|nr:CvpA family protein [Ignavibacteriales bacterium]
MLVDIPIGVYLIISTLLGLRDGLVRKAVGIVVLVLALILGQEWMHDAGKFLAEHAGFSKATAPMYGYLCIFLGALILQSLLYKLLAGGYKIGGIADRLIGAFLGAVHGAFFLSGLLFILAMGGPLSKDVTNDSRFYKPIVNLAPQVLDLTATAGPQALEKIKEVATPSSSSGQSSEKAKPEQKLDEESQKKMFDEARRSAGRKNP